MRIALTLLFSLLSSCLLPATAFHHPRKNHKASSAGSSVIASRQYQARRDLLDLCLYADASVFGSLLGLLNPLLANLHLCLCIKDLNIFLDTDVNAGLLLDLFGSKSALQAALELLINTSPHSRECRFPSHSHKVCRANDPCHWECDPGYVRQGDKCVCPPPRRECNGRCDNFPHGCPSASPSLARRHDKYTLPAAATTLNQAQEYCAGKTVCGVVGQENTTEFECVDTATSRNSCGGCLIPHPFYDHRNNSGSGINCKHLPGVSEASCTNSRCVVNCESGWVRSDDGSSCVENASSSSVSESTTEPLPGGSRMKKVKRAVFKFSQAVKRQDIVSIETPMSVDADTLSKIQTVVSLVIDLKASSDCLPAPAEGHLLPSSPHRASSHPVDRDLITPIVQAVVDLLHSSSSSALTSNILSLIDVTTIVDSTLTDCGCIDGLGLGDLVANLAAILDAVISLRDWHGNHTHAPSNGSPSSPSDTGLLGDLDLGSLLEGLGLGTNGTSNLLNLDSLQTDIAGLVNLIVKLNADLGPTHPSSISSSHASSIRPPTHSVSVGDIVENLVRTTVNLLHSTTVLDLQSNITNILDTSTMLNTTLSSCGECEGLHVRDLLEDVDDIIAASLNLLSLCQQVPPSAVNGHDVGSMNPIIINAEQLLGTLGLNDTLKLNGVVKGLGKGLSDPVNGLLNLLGLGGARR